MCFLFLNIIYIYIYIYIYTSHTYTPIYIIIYMYIYMHKLYTPIRILCVCVCMWDQLIYIYIYIYADVTTPRMSRGLNRASLSCPGASCSTPQTLGIKERSDASITAFHTWHTSRHGIGVGPPSIDYP